MSSKAFTAKVLVIAVAKRDVGSTGNGIPRWDRRRRRPQTVSSWRRSHAVIETSLKKANAPCPGGRTARIAFSFS
jgi:hypothetical protein